MLKSPEKILWAVDAFSKDAALYKKAASILKRWTKGTSTQIELVYVLTPDQLNVPIDLFAAVKAENEIEAKKNLDKLVNQVRLPNLLTPRLLVSGDFSLRSAAASLSNYAKETGAGLIVLGTQSKKGVSRFLFGSFAEMLLLQSSVPILLITPRITQMASTKRVLFATDLSDDSLEAYREVLEIAQKQKLQITLFNKVTHLTSDTPVLIARNPLYQKYIEKDLLHRNQVLNKLAKMAIEKGIQTQIILDQAPNGASVSDAILSAMRKHKCDLVAMASQANPMAPTSLGNIARQVICVAKWPIWMIRTKQATSTLKEELKEKKGAVL